MMTARKIVVVVAGVLIALRLFFPVEVCAPAYSRVTIATSNCRTENDRPGIRRVSASVTVLQAAGIAVLAGIGLWVTERRRE